MQNSVQNAPVVADFAGSNTPYRFQLATRIAEVDQARWEQVCRAATDPFMELRYLQAHEDAFRGDTQFWYATLFDDHDQPIGCTVFSRYLVDIVMLAPPILQWINGQVRRLWKNYMRVPVLLGGSPVSNCRPQLILKDGIDIDRAIAAIDGIVAAIVKQAKVQYIAFKEFAPVLNERIVGLKKYGYRCAHSNVTYDLFGDLSSFDVYYNNRNKRSRAKIRKTFQKFDAAGLTLVQCRGCEGALGRITDEVHRLYLNVLAKAKQKLERLPIEYFRELAKHYPEESRFTFIYQGDRPVGFCCGLDSAGQHTLLFCGLDYSLNAEADLYFNIIYKSLAYGLHAGVKQVSIGAAADQFKQQMGCRPTPLSIYLKGVGWMRSIIVNGFSWMLFPKMPVLPLVDSETDEAAPPARRAA